jgi:hypothetical protein
MVTLGPHATELLELGTTARNQLLTLDV